MVRRKPGEQCIHLDGDAFARDAGLDARNRLQKCRAPAIHNRPLHSQRNPQTRPARKLHPSRHHSDHSVALPVQANDPPDDLRVRAQLVAPHMIGDHHYRRRAHALVGTCEIAA